MKKWENLKWHLSDYMHSLDTWLDIVQYVQDDGKPWMVVNKAYLPHQNEVGGNQTYEDIRTVLGKDVPRTGGKVLRAFFTPASKGDQEQFLDMLFQNSEPDDTIYVMRASAGEPRFSHVRLFNAIAGFNGLGWCYAASNTFGKMAGMPDGVRVCRVSNQIPEDMNIRLVIGQEPSLAEVFQIQRP